jgi:aspartate dehydrogenase
MRIGLIGCGAVGAPVVAAWRRGELAGAAKLVAVLVRRPRPAEPDLVVTTERAAFLATRPQVVVEAAGHAALGAHGVACLEAGADLVVTSAGALVDDGLRESLEAAARAAGRRVVVASAGIGALDILAAAAVGGLDSVTVTVRKDPAAWYGTVAEQRADLGALAEAVTLFDGPVRKGARLYPQNVNIAAAAALAGLGLDRTRLVIIADPTICDHVVEIEASGWFGSFGFREAIVPTAENPRTGRLVALAVIKTLRRMTAPLVVGD